MQESVSSFPWWGDFLLKCVCVILQSIFTVCVFCLMLFNMAALKKPPTCLWFLGKWLYRACVCWQQESNACAFVFDPTLDCVVVWCNSSACSVSASPAACCDAWADVKCARVPATIASWSYMCVNVDTLSALHTVCVRLLHFPSVCHNQPSVPCLPPPPLHPSISPLFSSQTQSFNYLSFPLFSSFFFLSLSIALSPSLISTHSPFCPSSLPPSLLPPGHSLCLSLFQFAYI